MGRRKRAAVRAFPRETSTLAGDAPSMRTKATSSPAGSTTAMDTCQPFFTASADASTRRAPSALMARAVRS